MTVAARSGQLRVALAVVTVALSILAPAARAEPLRFGVNDTLAQHGEGPDRIGALYARLGVTVQRVNVGWRYVQRRRGEWDWAHVDRIVGEAASRGVETIAILGSVPPWAAESVPRQCLFDRYAAGCQPAPAAERLGDLQVFVRELARRYPTLAAIEVFNEPNLSQFTWQPAADPEHYARVLRAVHDAVEQVRPELPVLSGGLGPLPRPAPSGAMDPARFLERMYAAGARGAMDGIAVHPYPAGTSFEDPETNGYFRLMAEIRSIRDQHADAGRPLWITEVGYTTTGSFSVTLEEQARWLPMLVTDAFAESDVAAVIVHTLRESGPQDHPSTGYGLLSPDLAPKPVFDALAGTVGEITGRAVKQRRARRMRTARGCRRPARGRPRPPRTCVCRRTKRGRVCRRARSSRGSGSARQLALAPTRE